MSSEKIDLRTFADFEQAFPNGIEAIFFDFDKTLIKNDSWSLVFEVLSGKDGNDLYEQFLIEKEKKNPLAFQNFKRNVFLLLNESGKPVTKDDVEKIFGFFELRDYVREVIQKAKKLGIKIVVLTSGANFIEDYIKKSLPEVDEVRWNTEFVYDEEGFLEEYFQRTNFSTYKAEQLEKISQELGIALRDSIAVGDSLYDLGMFQMVRKAGGMTIAIQTKYSELLDVSRAHIQGFDEVYDFLGNYEDYLRSHALLRTREAS